MVVILTGRTMISLVSQFITNLLHCDLLMVAASFIISPTHQSNARYPLVNGGLGNHGGHSFSELYRRFDSRRYPQMINGVDVNRMTPEQIYDYFVSMHTRHHAHSLD
jgi:hypothetical protein